jgi:hypothetical protein
MHACVDDQRGGRHPGLGVAELRDLRSRGEASGFRLEARGLFEDFDENQRVEGPLESCTLNKAWA